MVDKPQNLEVAVVFRALQAAFSAVAAEAVL